MYLWIEIKFTIIIIIEINASDLGIKGQCLGHSGIKYRPTGSSTLIAET